MKVYAKQLGIVLQDFSMQNNEVNQVSESGGDGEDRPKRVSSGPTMEYVKEERDHEVESGSHASGHTVTVESESRLGCTGRTIDL